jgi:hypothetical protein
MDLNGITPVDAYSRTQPTKNTSKMTVHKALPTPKQEGVPLVIPKGPTTAISIPSKVLDPITDALNRTLNSNDTRNSPPEESVQPVLSSQSASDPFSEDPFPDLDSEYPPFLFNPQELSLGIPSYFNLKPFDPSKGVKKVGKLMLGDALDFHKVVNSLPVPTEHSITANNFNTNNSNASNNNNNTQPPVTANNGPYPINAPATHSKEHISIKANNSNARSYSATPPTNTNANIRPQPGATHIPSKLNASSVKPAVAPVQPKANMSLVPKVTQAPAPQKSSSKSKPITLPKSTIEIIPNGVMAKGDYKPIDEPATALNELVNGDISRLKQVDFEFAGENGTFVINSWKKDGVTKCKVPAIWTVTYRELDGNLKTIKMIGDTYMGVLFPSSKDEAGISQILWRAYLTACAYNLTARLTFDSVRKEAPFWGEHNFVSNAKRIVLSNSLEIPVGARDPILNIWIGGKTYSLPVLIPSNLKFYLGTEVEICPDTVIEPTPPPKPKPEIKPIPPEILQVLSKDDNFAENVNSLLRAQYTANGGRDLYSEALAVLNYLKSRRGNYGAYDFKGYEGAEEWESFCFKIERLEDHLTQWRATGSLPKVSKYSDAYEFARNYFFHSEEPYPNMGYMGEEDRKVLPTIMAIKKAEFEYLWERPTVASVQNEIARWWKKGTSGQTKLGDVIWEIRKAQEGGVINANRMKVLQAQIPALKEGIAWFNYACHNPVTYSGNYYYDSSLEFYNPSAWAELHGRRAASSNAYTSWQSQPKVMVLQQTIIKPTSPQYASYHNVGKYTQGDFVYTNAKLPYIAPQKSPSISAHYVWMVNEQGQFTAPIEKYGILKKAQWLKYS